MLEYGVISGAIAGAQGLFAAVAEGARRGTETIFALAAENPVVSVALLAGALALVLLRRR